MRVPSTGARSRDSVSWVTSGDECPYVAMMITELDGSRSYYHLNRFKLDMLMDQTVYILEKPTDETVEEDS